METPASEKSRQSHDILVDFMQIPMIRETIKV